MTSNIFEMLNAVQQSGNPQQYMMNMLQNSGNPMFQNLLSLAQNNNYEAIENIAKNIVSERGLDFDTEFQKFKSQLGIK